MKDDEDKILKADRFVSHPGDAANANLRKRFYESATSRAAENGFVIELDGRSIKTPARVILKVPTAGLGEAIAEEWNAQEKHIVPETMLVTKLANTALDRVGPRKDEVVDEIAAFGGSDLLCYRADDPESLVTRQAEQWDPLLDWLDGRYGARLELASGVIFKDQSPEVLGRLHNVVACRSEFELAGLHQAVSLCGSLVLGLALLESHITPDQAHDLAHLDEAWQAERWGWDEEAQARLEGRREMLDATAKYLELL
ncbi:ATP12 chaperone protein [Rhodobiaceae bacterium]|nr:ATP12 chaperone protein [Rhodobiaceae bacterium]